MTDVRRTGPPRRLADRTRFGIPIEGEVDSIWQRAFREHLIDETRRQPELPGVEFFGKSLTVNPEQITFYFVGASHLLPNYLDMIESAIPLANDTAAKERHRRAAAGAEADRNLRDRDVAVEEEINSWVGRQTANR
jgi:hypothetical protein